MDISYVADSASAVCKGNVVLNNKNSHYQLWIFIIRLQPTKMASFLQVQSLHTRPKTENFPNGVKAAASNCEPKCLLQLNIAGASELLSIICPSISIAEQIAELIDTYCRLAQQVSRSIWTRTTGVNKKPFL